MVSNLLLIRSLIGISVAMAKILGKTIFYAELNHLTCSFIRVVAITFH